MKNRNKHPFNQTIDELFYEYNSQLDECINSFALKFGYFPKDSNDFECSFWPLEVQETNKQFFDSFHIQKLDTLATLFADLREYFK